MNGCIFFAAAAAVCFGIGAYLPFPDIPTIGPKYRHFAAHRNDYDVLFVGSSRFFHQIIPKQFDAEVSAATGEHFRSFNLSCDALWPPESYYFLRKIYALHPQRLRWVFIELMDFDPRIDDRNRGTRRLGYWHDLKHTELAWQALEGTHLVKKDEAESMQFEHLGLMIREWANLGRGAEMMNVLLASHNNERDRSEEWRGIEGYRPGDENGLSGKELADYESRLQRMKKELDPIPMSALFAKAAEEIAHETRGVGAKPVFVIAPTVNFLENYSPTPVNVPLFGYNDPTKHPGLYDPAIHYDSWHLNPKGAVLFTTALATDFSGYLNAGEEAKPAPPK